MALQAFLDALFPPQCVGCTALGSGLCVACAPQGIAGVRTRVRGISIAAYGTYDGVLRTAILALKDGRRDVATALGERLAPLVGSGAWLVPVPTTLRRKRVRGIDGVALITATAAKISGARIACALEQSAGDAQRGRTRGERLAARGRFRCSEPLAGRRVLLVDDVCTTGATLEDCCRAATEAGATVEGAVVAVVTNSGDSWIPISAQPTGSIASAPTNWLRALSAIHRRIRR